MHEMAARGRAHGQRLLDERKLSFLFQARLVLLRREGKLVQADSREGRRLLWGRGRPVPWVAVGPHGPRSARAPQSPSWAGPPLRRPHSRLSSHSRPLPPAPARSCPLLPSCDRAEPELTAPGPADAGPGAAVPKSPASDGLLQPPPSYGLPPAQAECETEAGGACASRLLAGSALPLTSWRLRA